MVPVDHVVLAADPVGIDRRQLITFDHRLVDPRPAVAQAAVDGQKCGVEVPRFGSRRGRAHDPVERDLLNAAVSPALEARGIQHRLDRLQAASAPGQDRAHGAPEGAKAGGVEVLERPDPLQISP